MFGDILGAVATLIGLVAFREEIGNFIANVRERGTNAYELFRLWYHHNLAVRVRPMLVAGLLINTAFVIGAFVYIGNVVGLSWGAFLAYLVLTAVLLAATVVGPMAWALWRLQSVRPVDWETLRTDGDDAAAWMTPAEFRRRFGPTGQAVTVRSFLFFVTGIWITGIWFYFLGVAFYTWHGAEWYQVVPVLALGTIAGFLGYVAWAITALVVGRTIKEGGDVFNRLLNLLLRPAIIALPGIKDENYEQRWKEILLPFDKVGAWLESLHVTFFYPAGLLAAIVLVWPNFWVVMAYAVVLLGGAFVDYAKTRRGKMDTLPYIRRTFQIIGVAAAVIGLWRILQIVLWQTNGTRGLTPFYAYWNDGVEWTNRFLIARWYWGLLIVLIAAILFGVVYAMKPEAAPLKAARYTVLGMLALVLLGTTFGWLGRLAGGTPQVPTMGPATAADASTPSPGVNMVDLLNQQDAAPPSVTPAPPRPTVTPPPPPPEDTNSGSRGRVRRSRSSASAAASDRCAGLRGDFLALAQREGRCL